MGKRSKNRQELEVQDRHRFESKEANNEKLIKAHESKVTHVTLTLTPYNPNT